MRFLVFTVTNDLVFDQRMLRICSTLSQAGYQVTLVGRCYKNSPALVSRNFMQKRLHCFFRKGAAFYAEYSARLFFFLLFKKMDLVCAIDLDTILPCYLASCMRRKKRVYDAHELFCEMKEVVSRPRLYRFWKFIERNTVPHFKNGYTVNQPIRDIFEKQYGVRYQVIRNLPVLEAAQGIGAHENYILYQGAVNHGRSFETLIPAFSSIPYPLWIYGDGNFYDEAVRLVLQHRLQHKVLFKGKVTPEALKTITRKALLGITLFENNGLNNYLSLANRFFDYIHAGVPQLCVDYPAYRTINQQYPVAKLITDLSPRSIATAINNLVGDQHQYQMMQKNCLLARQELCWQHESERLHQFYKNAGGNG